MRMEHEEGKAKNSTMRMSQIKTERSPRKVENSRQRDQNIKRGTSAEAKRDNETPGMNKEGTTVE